jgi:cytochrome P450
MPTVTDADLPTLAIESPEFDSDPWPLFDVARRRHPWLARYRDGYVVHGYKAIKEMIVRDDKLVPAIGGLVEYYGGEGTMWARFMKEMLLSTPAGTDHSRIRASVAPAFTPRTANRFKGEIRQVMRELLDKWTPGGRMDFADFISHFPVTVFARLLGARADPMAVRANLEVQANSITFDKSLLPELLAGYDVLSDFVDGVVKEREASGSQDDGWLDAMIASRDKGEIDATELHFLLMMLFPAGYDTSKNMIAMTFHTLLAYPEHWARCAEDRAFCSKVVEEMFRFAPVAPPMRTVSETFDYDGFTFEPGTLITFVPAIAGRDPSIYEEPDRFDPERVQQVRHIGFGQGSHICLGMHLARLQIEEAIHMCAQRIRNPRLTGEATWRHFLGIWGPKSLPVEFDPGEERPFDEVSEKAAA